MNMLIDLVPTTIEIEGEEYEINSNFRVSILFELLMQDNSISEENKIIQALQLYYPVIPPNINLAVDKMLWFYRCGKDILPSKGTGKGKSTQIYNFEYDDDYIYSAFLDQYRIDLQDIEYLHWWKFKALFKALREDNEIVKIMGYRSMDLSKIKDKEEKSYYRKMQELYKIPIAKDEKDKLEEINNILLNGGDVGNLL
ncbi:bacteriophage Gp15 family protein [Clostridium botulinum]|uniref:bacteriophage Gp15 family protein n=1 Tax=Clostridium botulinum TaxID=1491 RepID=UPI001C9B3F4D|nr:bacteriophage Gp15 family protein [Clostridium botulinum]MBY6797075.1 bacteriophage Gp15 family protein [Clostridium botulinum]MBY6866503.1 bacteriophage Gp15 family protein [Clostridium botulinum]